MTSALIKTKPADIIMPDFSEKTARNIALRQFFDLEKAYKQVLKDCKSKSTLKAYSRDLPLFLRFLDDNFYALPNPEVMRDYMAVLRDQGLKSTTINRYLAPARKFAKFLSEQSLNYRANPNLIFDLIDTQNLIRAAAAIKGPSADETNYESPLMQHGTRLSVGQANELLATVKADTRLSGLRDYALLVVGFNSMLRVAELARLKLSSFQLEDAESGTYRIKVPGKRNNTTPVPCPRHAYEALLKYVEAYNAALPSEDDPRRITEDTPVWRPLQPYSGAITADIDIRRDIVGHKISMSSRSISSVVTTRAKAYNKRLKFSPHDMRRTGAYIAFMNGFSMREIQMMLRHKSLVTTEKYIGVPRDYKRANLATKVIIA